jgi:alpha-L-fucosidase
VPAAPPDKISSTIVLTLQGAPDIEQPVLAQSADGALTLAAAEAICHGEVRYEGGHNRDCLGFWLKPADWVEWQFKVTQPGRFTVTADLASQASGSFEVILGEQRLRGKAPNTGDYGKFQPLELGTLELPGPGRTSLSIKPIPDGWAPLNLKSLRFKPVR